MSTHTLFGEAPGMAEDANMARVKNVLNRVILIFFVLTGIGLIATVLVYERKSGSLLTILALLLTIIIAKFLLQREQIRKASVCAVSGLWLIFAFIVIMGGGLNNINVVFFVAVTVVAGLLLGERPAVLVAAAGITTGLALALMDIFGYLPSRYFLDSPLGNWTELVFAIVLTTSTLNLALRERNNALATAKKQLSDRMEAEKALRESEELHDKLISAIPDTVVRTNIDGEIRFVNDIALQVSGYERSELIGKNMISFVVPEDREKVFQNTLLMMEQPLGPKQYRLVMKDGEKRFFEANGDVLRTENGIPYSIVNVLRDITDRVRMERERKELQERLYRAEKMEALGTLAGGVAHDLNNVLGVMVGYSELLAQNLPEGSPTRRHADNILKSSIRGAAIIQDLLTLARRGVSVSEVVNLNKLICDYLQTPEFEKLKYHHPQVEIVTELEDGLLNIKGSSVHLGKTIMNLVSNAVESIAGPGEVTIRTKNRYLDRPIHGYDKIREGDYAVLTVHDTGSGISADDLGKIFEPFYTKKVMGRSGTGLGLAVVWGTVKDHSGYIDAQSEEGNGSRFALYFPVTREAPAKVQKAVSPVAYLGKGESILVVDDVKEQRQVATSMLESIGYRVEAVSSGEEAVERLKDKKPDLLVLDMIMDPGIDGMETYRRILEINPGQKAVIASGFSETDRVHKTQEMGAGAFIRKPYILEKIGLAVRDALDRK